jgi:hypothetical protein
MLEFYEVWPNCLGSYNVLHRPRRREAAGRHGRKWTSIPVAVIPITKPTTTAIATLSMWQSPSLRQARHPWKLLLASYFVRINFDYGRDLSAFFLTAFRMVGTDPSFNVTTGDKWHVKHRTVIRWRANV